MHDGRVSIGFSKPTRRLHRLDALRGLAVVAMFAYHFIWDLAYFRFVPAETTRSFAFAMFGHSIAISFIGVAGFSLALASRNGLNARAFINRLAMICAAAGAVTLVTWVAFPQAFVTYGILHCIAAASVLCLPFIGRAPHWALMTGVVMIALPMMFTTPALDHLNGFLGLEIGRASCRERV